MMKNSAEQCCDRLELRISKMINEGGLGAETYYPNTNSTINKKNKTNEEIFASRMISEGGIGAEIYYTPYEKIAKLEEETEKNIN